jgi:hypothetical protein
MNKFKFIRVLNEKNYLQYAPVISYFFGIYNFFSNYFLFLIKKNGESNN